ncbi:MAG: MmcQ/YjbR family DNA-binding protein [Candidatus Sulfotelmatobacter sp.]|jgi:predicted DNA-binding protein (MmcQ/YjbR family)
MNVDAIREYCLAFDQATEKLQWGDNLCFKIAGKIFAIVGLDNPRICFKCAAEVFAELIEREDIRPAPYLGRYEWVMLDRLDAVGGDELRELMRRSYEMVVAKTPKKSARMGSKKKLRKIVQGKKSARAAARKKS